ncbi:MAG: hypothetical protein K8S14_10560 [Actinomycetia bacterium]|nr:hypothetical protein [Actinomycetes bacterium]
MNKKIFKIKNYEPMDKNKNEYWIKIGAVGKCVNRDILRILLELDKHDQITHEIMKIIITSGGIRCFKVKN